jgi:hypothetical protein
MVVIGASFGGSIVYDYTISDAVKSTLNNWFSDTPEQTLNLKILSIAFNASSLAPKTLAVSTYFY